MAENKTKPTAGSVEACIAAIESQGRRLRCGAVRR